MNFLAIIDTGWLIGFGFLTVFTAIVTGMLFGKYQMRNLIHERETKHLKVEADNRVLRAQVETQEQTFQNLSKEIHDDIGQKLSLMKMYISHPNIDTRNEVPEMMSEVICQLRDMSKSLSADIVRKDGLYEAILQDIEKLNDKELIQATLQRSQIFHFLSDGWEIVVYRIYQEAVHNVLKHAEASKLMVRLDYEKDHLLMRISDNGKGFNPQNGSGQGLRNMASRAKTLGGSSNIHSNENGTHLIFNLPYNTDEKN